ncbi:MAG: hypothetical protein M1305_03640 [Candidatus Marsarchaeota archaeon]|nr:hypothetical protein [Candidatus Marsarchaeota archaeon]
MQKEELAESSPYFPDIQQNAQTLIDDALGCCVSRGVCDCAETLSTLLRRGDGNAHSYFRRALAEKVAKYLSEMDGTIRAAYCYQCGAPAEELEADEMGISSEASLLLHVERRTAALSSMISALDQACVSYYRSLLSPIAANLRFLLDVQVVDDEDVHSGRGLATLLNSSYTKPVRIL